MPGVTLRPIEALADPVRRYIVELLCVIEQSSGDIAVMCFDRFRISWGAVSKHLATLTASELTVVRRKGPMRLYRLADDWLEQLDSDVDDLRRHWTGGAATRELVEPADVSADDGRDQAPRRRPVAHRGRSITTSADFGHDRRDDTEWAEEIMLD